ncbi:MAG: hypothetical protein JST28_17840 [Acidobacteria bacterium]|nr:hypothetical protein [Acidobacteriota bacterium]
MDGAHRENLASGFHSRNGDVSTDPVGFTEKTGGLIRIASWRRHVMQNALEMERAYRNLGYVLLALIPIFIAGFWIPYLSEFPRLDASITAAVHVHAILLFCFLALLIIQPIAIRFKAFSAHRKLGKLTNALMPFILIFSVAMLWKEYREHLADGASISAARNDEFLSAVQLVLLGSLYGLALSSIKSRNVSAHMRYMICIVLVVLPAGLARTLGYWLNFRQSTSQTICLILIDALLVALIAYDRRSARPSRPFQITLAAYVLIEISWYFLGRPV